MRACAFFLVLFLSLLEIIHLGNNVVESYRSLPLNLRECYSNDGIFAPALPLNLQTVIDVIRKIERKVHTFMPMKTLSAALVKRYKMDGIVFSETAVSKEGILRYAAAGAQRAKNRVVEQLIPGDTTLLPDDVLTKDERCLLHFAMSNTIWEHQNPGEESFCGPGPQERSSGRSIRSLRQRCPKEGGVILTPFNTVALGSVITAIAAALEPQVVKTKLLMQIPLNEPDEHDRPNLKPRTFDPDPDDDDIDFVIPREQMNTDRSMWMESVRISDTQIDNVWIATIAGELAELVIYQGPIYVERMFLGATGFWNSTISPKLFYVKHAMDSFDVTRAEIVGGIDGLIIAKNLDKWMKNFNNLRLSQVLDMYYSEKGIVFDKNVKACYRGQQFPIIAPKTIMEEQTYAASQVLAYLNSIAAMSDAAFQRLVVRAVLNFDRYTDERLFSEYQCRARRRKPGRVEVLVAFDGSWTPGYTHDFVSVLVDDFDVSVYNSKLGLINGETGEFVIKVSNSPADIHQSLNNLANVTWPKSLKLTTVFETVEKYLNDSWNELHNNNTIGNMGQAVVLLVPDIKLTDDEMQQALTALKNLKSKHPETRFMYYTTPSTTALLKPFLLSEEDRIVDSLEVDDISRILSTVPATLRPTACNKNLPSVKTQLEDYANPVETVTYRLHPQWRVKGKRVSLTMHGVGYGSLKVCWWNQMSMNKPALEKNCKVLSKYDDLVLTDNYLCENDKECPSTYIEISNVTTATRCTEFDCRTPDQVRYIIRTESFQCQSSSGIACINLYLLILLICIKFIT